jgi:long-subunit fatty acid transport protein
MHYKKTWMRFTRLSMVLVAGFIGLAGVTERSEAQVLGRIQPASSFNPVGSGARALGMGGAFIGVADDATAASWNPGGLIQLERPEISFVGAGIRRNEDNTFAAHPEASGDQWVDDIDINYLSIAYPFSLANHDMIVSINYQTLYDLNREWNYPFFRNSGGLSYTKQVRYAQEGSLSAIGLAYCVQFTPDFSFGITLNTWDDDLLNNQWEETERQTGSGTNFGNAFTSTSLNVERYTLSGYNANIGFLWHATPKLTIGAVVKTPFEADLERESSSSEATRFPGAPGSDVVTPLTTSVQDETLEMPLSLGMGLAYRFSDAFTASLDVYRTEWGDFVRTDAQGNETSFVSGKALGESDIDPTHQIRMGAEYLFIRSHYAIPVRCGIFYDPAPAEGHPDDFYGFSVGSGIALGGLIFDMAYQYRFGNDVGQYILDGLDFSQDVEEHTFYASIIIHL